MRLAHCRVKPPLVTFQRYLAKLRDIFCCNVKRVKSSVKGVDELSDASLTNDCSA